MRLPENRQAILALSQYRKKHQQVEATCRWCSALTYRLESSLWHLCFATQQASDQINCGNFKYNIVLHLG